MSQSSDLEGKMETKNRNPVARSLVINIGRPDSRDMNSMRDQGEPPKRRGHKGR